MLVMRKLPTLGLNLAVQSAGIPLASKLTSIGPSVPLHNTVSRFAVVVIASRLIPVAGSSRVIPAGHGSTSSSASCANAADGNASVRARIINRTDVNKYLESMVPPTKTPPIKTTATHPKCPSII